MMTFLCGIVFEPLITIGNLLTIGTFLVFAAASFASLRERSKANTQMLAQLKGRLDSCFLEQMKERVDTMWIFQLRRGLQELEIKGLGVSKSPVQLSERAKDAIAPLLPDLQKFYKEIDGDTYGPVDLGVRIEQEFGERLVKEVCTKLNITDGACLIVALAALRPISKESLTESINKTTEMVRKSLSIRKIPTPLPIRKALLFPK